MFHAAFHVRKTNNDLFLRFLLSALHTQNKLGADYWTVLSLP